MGISDWSSDVCSSDLKVAVQRPQETLRHRLALGYESCDLSRHYVPPDLLIWGSLGATLRRIRYRGGSRKSRQTTGKTEFCQDFRSANRDRPAEAKLWFRSLRGCRLTAPGGLQPPRECSAATCSRCPSSRSPSNWGRDRKS